MAKKTVGMSVTEETRARFLALFPEPFTSGEEKLLKLLDAYENRENNNVEANIEENPQYIELKERFDVAVQDLTEARASVKQLFEENGELHERQFVSADELVLKISPAQTELLALVKERLEKQLNRQLSNEDILLTPFVRYNLQQWTKWFYPFVVSVHEVKAIFERNKTEE